MLPDDFLTFSQADILVDLREFIGPVSFAVFPALDILLDEAVVLELRPLAIRWWWPVLGLFHGHVGRLIVKLLHLQFKND